MLNKKISSYLLFGGAFILLLAQGSVVQAQIVSPIEINPLARFLREFSVFLNLILAVFIVLLVIGLHGALKYVGKDETLLGKIKLIFQVLTKDAADIFVKKVKRDPNGVYTNSFHDYAKFHNFSRKTFLRTVGLAVLQIAIVVVLIYGFTTVVHNLQAQDSGVLRSKNLQLQPTK